MGLEESDEELFTAYRKARTDWDKKAIRDILIVRYLPICERIASRLAPKFIGHMELEDLCSEGVFGLIQVIDDFRLEMNVKFSTFAHMRIRGAILDAVRSYNWAPRLVLIKTNRLRRAVESFQRTNGRDPDDNELALSLGVNESKLSNMRMESAQLHLRSLQERVGYLDGENNTTLIDVLPCKKDNPANSVVARIGVEEIAGILDAVDRRIFILYTYEGWSMLEMGKLLGITEARVCQRIAKITERLESWRDRHLSNQAELR